MSYGCAAFVQPVKCIELAKMTMVFLPSFYQFLFDTNSESGNRRRIEFCFDTHSLFFYRIKIESVGHYKLKTTSIL